MRGNRILSESDIHLIMDQNHVAQTGLDGFYVLLKGVVDLKLRRLLDDKNQFWPTYGHRICRMAVGHLY